MNEHVCNLVPCMDAERILRGECCGNCGLFGRRKVGEDARYKNVYRFCCEGGVDEHWTERNDWCVFWRSIGRL